MRPDRQAVFLAFAAFAATGGPHPAPAAVDSVHVAFEPALATVACSTQVAVDITVDATAVDLRGFSLVVEFDPLLVEIDAVLPGPQINGGSCGTNFFFHSFYTAGDDSVGIDGATLGCSTAGPGAIARIVFRGLGTPGSTALLFRRHVLRDSTNATVPSLGDPGWIDVDCTIPVVPTTWARTKAEYRARGSP